MNTTRIRRRFAVAGLLAATVIFGASVAAPVARAATSVMTFDTLAADFAPRTTYTENGLTITFPDGAGEHFHTVAGSPGTGALFFASDGSPARFATGGTFSFLSVDILGVNGTATFTATPGGATVVVTSSGTVIFPETFRNITSVALTQTLDATLDNVNFTTDFDPAGACVPGAATPAGYNLIEGGGGSDNLVGTSAKELIRGLGGNDTIRAYSSNDIVCGNDGTDTLYGGSGNDVLVGGPGTDTLNGDSGTDRGLDPDGDTTRFSIESNV